MKKLLLIIEFIVMSLGFEGCQDSSDLQIDTHRELRNVADRKITTEDAKKEALNFVYDICGNTRVDNSLKIREVYAWQRKDFTPSTRYENHEDSPLDTLAYIVNFENNEGYVVVSSDRLTGVAAYVEEGNLSPTDIIENTGLSLFF